VRPCRNYADLKIEQKQQKMILDQEKHECIDSISQSLQRTAAWRRTLAVKFDDPRNEKAAQSLEKLALAAADLTDSQWEELKPRFGGWASQTWRSDLSKRLDRLDSHIDQHVSIPLSNC
jgi:hypothetical protein